MSSTTCARRRKEAAKTFPIHLQGRVARGGSAKTEAAIRAGGGGGCKLETAGRTGGVAGLLVEDGMTVAGVMIGKGGIFAVICLNQGSRRRGILPPHLQKKVGGTAALIAAALIPHDDHADILLLQRLFQLFQVSQRSLVDGDQVILGGEGATTAVSGLLGVTGPGHHCRAGDQDDLTGGTSVNIGPIFIPALRAIFQVGFVSHIFSHLAQQRFTRLLSRETTAAETVRLAIIQFRLEDIATQILIL